MLKKRILASSMASVMALTSISAVAFADDTFDTSKAVVTKDELKSYLASKEIKELIDGKVEDYGTVSGSNFSRACEFAQKVVEDSKYNDDYATLAYQMVKAEKDKLVQYTAAQLRDLIKEYRPIYETDNILNSNDDKIYYGDTWTPFTEAFVEAEGYSESDNIRDTTDQYEKLEKAKKGLSAMPKRTKAQLDSAMQAYEKALKLENNYQPWQRGTTNGSTVAWGWLYDHCASGYDEVKDRYDKFTAIKGLAETTNEEIVAAVDAMNKAASLLNGFKSNFASGGQTAAGALMKKYHGQLIYTYEKATTEALLDKLVAIFGAANVEVYTVKSGEAKVDWHTVADLVSASSTDRWNATTQGFRVYSAELKIRIKSTASAPTQYAVVSKNNTPAGKPAYVPGSALNADAATAITAASSEITAAATNTAIEFLALDASKCDTVKFEKGQTYTLSDYIALAGADMQGDGLADWYYNDGHAADFGNNTNYINACSGNGVADGINEDGAFGGNWIGAGTVASSWFTNNYGNRGDANTTSTAMGYAVASYAPSMKTAIATLYNEYLKALAENYSGEYTAINQIDYIGSVGNPTGKSSAEWKVIYNYMKYALEDRFEGSVGQGKTRKDVRNLIDESYKLATATVSTSLFTYSHDALVAERQNANDWDKATLQVKPSYIDYKTPAYYAGSLASDVLANEAWNELNAKYVQLNDEYNAFKYSYTEVAEKIIAAAKELDKKDNEDLAKKVAAAAAALIEVEEVKNAAGTAVLPDSAAFTEDGDFNGNNRLYTRADSFNGLVTDNVGTKFVVGGGYGTNSTHGALNDALNALTKITEREMGDVDGKNGVNVADVTLVLKHIAKISLLSDADAAYADMDGKNGVNVADATEILKKIAKNAG